MRTYRDKEDLKNEICQSFEKYNSEFDTIPEKLSQQEAWKLLIVLLKEQTDKISSMMKHLRLPDNFTKIWNIYLMRLRLRVALGCFMNVAPSNT